MGKGEPNGHVRERREQSPEPRKKNKKYFPHSIQSKNKFRFGPRETTD
jgi:hypothetical protein